MKKLRNNLVVGAFAIFSCAGIYSCGDNGETQKHIPKEDTIADPADKTNAVVSDSTMPQGAVGLDTVAGGQSSSRGIKDTTKNK